WLEEYLAAYEGAVAIISHDRYFMDRVCKHIAELDRKKITDYPGTYDEYEIQKEAQKDLLQSAYEQQQSEIKRIELFVERFRYKATKARQVQSHLKMLNRIDRIELPDDYRKVVKFRFPQPARSGRLVVELNNILKRYDSKTVFDQLTYAVYRG